MAKLKIDEYLKASETVARESIKDHVVSETALGELYVLRCPAMKEQIFKIGFTTGDSIERAEELSSATGVPLAFIVVKKWRHRDARKLETEVHMMLAPYRMNNSREFFMADYVDIEKIIDSVIERTS